MSRRWPVVALLCGALFWIRLLHSYVTHAPSRVFELAPRTCYSPVVVVDGLAYQACRFSDGDSLLARIDLATGHLDRVPLKFNGEIRGFARAGDGTPFFVIHAGHLQRLEGNALVEVRQLEFIIALHASGNDIELVHRTRRGLVLETLSNGVWTTRPFPTPTVPADRSLALIGAEKRNGAWRVIYGSIPTSSEYPVAVEILVGENFGPLRPVATVSLGEDWVGTHEGRKIAVLDGLLLLPESGMMPTYNESRPPFEWDGARAIPIATPPRAGMITAFDRVWDVDRFVVQTEHAARVHDSWFGIEGQPRVQITRTSDQRVASPYESDRAFSRLLPNGRGYFAMHGLDHATLGPEL